MNRLNDLSSTSESDSEYLVDSRYCRTTVKCKRKALKKTIKLIHGRCVVIYRGSGDLLPIAAKDADRNCYCDFVFVCHEPKPIRAGKEPSILSRSRSALQNSSTSDDDNARLPEQNSFSFKTRINDINNNNEKTESANRQKNNNKPTNHHSQLILEEIDLDVDELIHQTQPSASIVYSPSSNIKSRSNIGVEIDR